MHIDYPLAHQHPALKQLWAEAFGDPDSFISLFFETAFSPRRCLCVTEEDRVCSALYWLDCCLEGRRLAYLYAVATRKEYRGRGFCRSLVEKAHALLLLQGYCGTVLVPATPELFTLYGKLGYQTLACMDTFSCQAQGTVSLKRVSAPEFANARKALLPPGGVEQQMGLTYLERYAELYTGDGFTLAGTREANAFTAMELLGNAAAAPGILNALGLSQGRFRIPGTQPFAMYHPLTDASAPGYFGLAFD